MKAGETRFQVILEGSKQFRVPLFQRTYSWNAENWRTLWKDLLETYEMDGPPRHFLGSVVTKSLPSTPDGLSPFLVIDGQQRLTTLSVVLAALRDVARASAEMLARQIHESYLTNRFSAGPDHYKVMPTQADRLSFLSVVGEQPARPDRSRIGEAYVFFSRRLAAPDPDGRPLELPRLCQVILNGLEIVSITLDEHDNEYRIFESLNGKGERLTQADLIRNYFFMRMPLSDQDAAYQNIWEPIQSMLGAHLESFFRYDLMLTGQFVRSWDVYQDWKRHLDRVQDNEIRDELTRIFGHAKLYRRMVHPGEESDTGIGKALARLNRWGGQTMYPFILHVYILYAFERIEARELHRLLNIVESFLVRRAMCAVPTNALNRLFLRLAHQLPQDQDLVSGVRAVLSEPSRRWPTDKEFRAGILRYPLYTDSRPDQRRLILESLEESFAHPEPVDLSALTIEHVMPQTLTHAWRQALGPSARDVHESLVHTLGNLTLTGFNSPLGAKPFAEKRQKLKESNVSMSKHIAEYADWTEGQIIDRANQLADRAIAIWPGPNP